MFIYGSVYAILWLSPSLLGGSIFNRSLRQLGSSHNTAPQGHSLGEFSTLTTKRGDTSLGCSFSSRQFALVCLAVSISRSRDEAEYCRELITQSWPLSGEVIITSPVAGSYPRATIYLQTRAWLKGLVVFCLAPKIGRSRD